MTQENEGASPPLLLLKQVRDLAITPRRRTEGSAGLDLFSAYRRTIPPRRWVTAPTGWAIQTPKETYARIAPRSGHAHRQGIMVLGGVIDEDYRGEIKVMLYNPSSTTFRVMRGTAIAQLIIERIMYPTLQIGEELDDTERGSRGFGSTDKSNESRPLSPLWDEENNEPMRVTITRRYSL